MTDNHLSAQDQRILLYIQAAEQLRNGDYALEVPAAQADKIGQLGEVLLGLARKWEAHYHELQTLDAITASINAGLLLDEILENVYEGFWEIIPYNRIGLSLIEDDGQTVRAYWAKTDQPEVRLAKGYAAPMAGSSLATVIETGQPRILNDLEEYLRNKPHSTSTRLIVEEGIRSSLTCPLVANGVPVGFLFFSSTEPDTYTSEHVDTFLRIAAQLSVIVEKGRLVTELAEQKAAIERQNEELLRLNDLKNTFLGIAAHDLRNPISYIQMVTDLLRDVTMLADVEHDTLLQEIGERTQYMLGLLDELLDVTQIEAGRLDLQLEPVDMARFLQEAIARHARMAAPKATQVLLEPVPPGEVMADSLRLCQAIDNLISNAVKYSPAGSTVTVSVRRSRSEWRVSVHDEGPGIRDEERKQLFQYFSRLSAQPTGGESSTGLGLAITRRVVEAHGGQIGVASEPGQGATFWFTLPDRARS